MTAGCPARSWSRRWSTGCAASGMEVLRIGRGPTPMLYYAATTLETDGAVMVTGSHNPPDYNGFKMMLGGKPFFGAADPRDRRAWPRRATWCRRPPAASATIDIADDYIARLLRRLGRRRPHAERGVGQRQRRGRRRAGEAGRVAAGRAHRAERRRSTARFPAHHPDPTVPKNLAAADRRGARAQVPISASPSTATPTGSALVDDTGEILFGDQLLVLLARDVLKAHPGATIIADVKASQVLFDEIAKAGGMPLMWKTGHSLIKAKMAETGCPLAGEMSGHIFFADHWYGFDDALYAAVRAAGHRRAHGRQAVGGARGAAAGDQHAGTALRLRRRAQIRGDRGSRRPAASRGREGVRTSMACGCRPRTAGGCCAPPTRRRCWSPAARRRPRRGWSG